MTTGTKQSITDRRYCHLAELSFRIDALKTAVITEQPVGASLTSIAAYALDWLEHERGLDGEDNDFQE
jgi:hypothetical protein